MAEQFEITDVMREKIGWESPPWTYEVSTTSVQAFARGVGYRDLVYYDADAAKRVDYPAVPAPPTYLGTPHVIPGKSHPVFSGPISGGIDLETGLPSIIDGETEIEYFGTICAGETLTAVTRLADLETKKSKAIGTMLLEKYETSYRNVAGELLAVMRFQIIRF